MEADSLNSPDDSNGYEILKSWIEDSLDQFKQDLLQIKYPLFVHTYFDLLLKNAPLAKIFFNANVQDFDMKSPEIQIFSSFSDIGHVRENSIAQGYKSNKYVITMGKYAFNLLLNFLEEKELNYLLKLINQHIEIKVGEKGRGVVHATNGPVNLTTFLVSNECEESILKDEKYKYDHLETFVNQLRKKRENKNTGYTASYVNSEIEKLKDLLKRVPCTTEDPPSVLCYTIYNTEITCAEFSPDLKLLAVANNVVEVHSVSDEPLKILKRSSELEMSETKTQHDEKNFIKLVGHSGPVYALKFFQSNKFLVSAGQDCTARLWSIELGSCVSIYKSGFPIWSVDIARDFYIAFGSADRVCFIYSLICQKPERIFTALSDVTCIKFHPNSNYIFYGSSDTHVRMTDIHTSEMVRVFSGHSDMITCLDVSHCGQFLATGSRDKIVGLWEISTGKNLAFFKSHVQAVSSVSFCWFGPILASTGMDGSVRLFCNGKGCVGVFWTKNTPLFCGRFGYRNILGVVGPYINSE